MRLLRLARFWLASPRGCVVSQGLAYGGALVGGMVFASPSASLPLKVALGLAYWILAVGDLHMTRRREERHAELWEIIDMQRAQIKQAETGHTDA